MSMFDRLDEIQRRKIRTKNPKSGMFIQLESWFGDVWAEVLDVFSDYVKFVTYSKDGSEREARLENFCRARRVIARDKLKSMRRGVTVVHFADRYLNVCLGEE